MLNNFVELVQQEVDHCIYDNIDHDLDGDLSYVFRYIFRGVKVKGLILGRDIIINENQKFMFEKYGLQPIGILDTDIFIKAGQFTRLIRTYLYECGAYPIPDKYVETNTYSITCKLGVRARGNARPTSKRDFFFVKLRESLDFLKSCRKNYSFEELRGLTEQASLTNHFMRRHKSGIGGISLADRSPSDLQVDSANYFSGHSLRAPVGGFPFPRSSLPPAALLVANRSIHDGNSMIFGASSSGLLPSSTGHRSEPSSSGFFKRQRMGTDILDSLAPKDSATAAEKAASESFHMLVDELGYLRDRVFQLENLLLDLKRLDQPDVLVDEEATGYTDLYQHSSSVASPLQAAPHAPQRVLDDPQRHPGILVGSSVPVFQPPMPDYHAFDASMAPGKARSSSARSSVPLAAPLFPPPADDIRQMIGDGSQLVNLTKEELMGLVRLMSRATAPVQASSPAPAPVPAPVPITVSNPISVPVPIPVHSPPLPGVMLPSLAQMSSSMIAPYQLPVTYPRAGAIETPLLPIGVSPLVQEVKVEQIEKHQRPQDEEVVLEQPKNQIKPIMEISTIMPMSYPLMDNMPEEEETLLTSSRTISRTPRHSKRNTKVESQRMESNQVDQIRGIAPRSSQRLVSQQGEHSVDVKKASL